MTTTQNTIQTHSKSRQVLTLFVLVALWALLWLPLQSLLVPGRFATLNPASRFILALVLSFILIAAFQIIFLFGLVKFEKPADVRRFFKIEKLDVRGIWLTFGLGIALQVLNAAFLWRFLLQPVQNFLGSVGLSSPDIGLGTGSSVPALSPVQAIILTVFLLLFWWLEVPEELFFRGYFQNRLQSLVGKNAAMVLSALVWDLAHLWSLASILERFLYGLVYAFVFRLRQNTTGPMLVHPLGNRALLLAVAIPQIWGLQANSNSPGFWLFLLGIYVLLLFGAIGLWRLLKLDR